VLKKKYFQVFFKKHYNYTKAWKLAFVSSIFKYFLKSPKKCIIHVCLNQIGSMSLLCHKVHGSWFGNIFCWKFVFHTFIWNRYKCHSFICIVWTLMLCTLFKHGCWMSIHVIYTQKSCTCVATLTLGSWLRQKLAKVRTKSEARESQFMLPGGWECRRVWENEHSHSQVNSHFGN
jgi:hypothetical protein